MSNKTAAQNTFNEGLVTDIDVKVQKKSTYRFALNGMPESDTGDVGSIVNHKGNEICFLVTAGVHIIGSLSISDTEIVLFMTNNTDSRISVFNTVDKSLTDHFTLPCLNFSTQHPITALMKVFQGCKRFIYFTDNLNPYRVINLDEDYSTATDCETLRYTRSIDLTPEIELESINSTGGQIPVGSVSFAIRLLDEDLNPTGWMSHSNNVPIYSDLLSTNYEAIEGDPTDFPTTNKSITLNFNNIDTTFKYVQLAAIYATSGNGTEDQVFVDDEIQISGSSMQYTYTGTTNSTTSTLSEVNVDLEPINIVKAHAQLDNRLFLANITNENFDYSVVQQLANDIIVTWESEVKTRNIDTGVRGGTYYMHTTSFCRDEVYAFGIYGRTGNRVVTPVFHIPGRDTITDAGKITTGNGNSHTRNQVPAGQNWDTQLLTVISSGANGTTQVNLEEVRHLGFTNAYLSEDPYGVGNGKVERWRVYNTGIANSEFEGEMAYYETQTDYPNTLGTDTNRMYPTGKVRHHKFPDTILSAHVRQSDSDPFTELISAVPIGIKLDLTAFLAGLPAELQGSDISWHVVRGIRTNSNRTVIDKGYIEFAKLWDSETNPVNFSFHDDVYSFWSPSSQLKSAFPGGSYLGIRNAYEPFGVAAETTIWNPAGEPFINNESGPAYWEWVCYFTKHDVAGQPYNGLLNGVQYIDRAATPHNPPLRNGIPTVFDDIDGKSIGNELYNTRRLFMATDNSLPLPALSGNFDPAPGSTTNRNQLMKYYVAVKGVNFNIYTSLDSIIYYDMDSKSYTNGELTYGGDIFISRFLFDKRYTYRNDVARSDKPEFAGAQCGATITDLWYETEVNSELRHVDTTIYRDYFRPTFRTSVYFIPTVRQLIQDYFDPNPDIRLEDPQPEEYLEPYYYNDDYTHRIGSKPHVPLSSTFLYDIECDSSYPYRIYHSEKTFTDQITDNYRVIKTNNFTDDLSGNPTEINFLLVERGRLYALTNNAAYHVSTRPQTLTTEDSNVVLGTGDVFAVPPTRLVSLDISYGGTKDILSVSSSEFGTFYLDYESKRVFLLSDSLQEISNTGNYRWFNKNIPIKLLSLYKDFSIRTTTDPLGVGFCAIYDPIYKIYFLTKKDYYPLDPINTTFDGVEWTNSGTPVSPDDPDYFSNHSWTLSYYVPGKQWHSFHSFIPELYMRTANQLFTSKSGVYQHYEGKYQRFYNTKYPFIVDFIVNENPTQTKTLSAINILSDVYYFDEDTGYYGDVERTFDSIVAYNSKQSTLEKPLTPITGLQPYTGDTFVHFVEDSWKISDLRNHVSDYTIPIWTNAWDDIKADYFIDKVPTVHPAKTFFDTERLRDKYFGIRLTFNPTEDYKIVTESVTSILNNSYR